MSNTEEIKSCPACGSNNFDISWAISCNDCGTRGPNAKNKKEKIKAWNAMPRREDFYLELVRVGATADVWNLRPRIIKLSEKYAPEDST